MRDDSEVTDAMTLAGVAALCRADELLLADDENPTPGAWLEGVLAALSAQRTYDERVMALADQGRPERALLVAASGESRGTELASAASLAAASAWTQLANTLREQRAGLIRDLSQYVHDARSTTLAPDAIELRTRAEEIVIPGERPRSVAGVRVALDAREQIARLRNDTEALALLTAEEIEARRDRIREGATTAAQALLRLMFEDDVARRGRAAHALRILPDLVTDQRIDIIERLAAGEINEIEIHAERDALAGAPLPATRRHVSDLAADLSPVSRSVLESARGTVTPIASVEDLRKLRDATRDLPAERRQQILLAQARATQGAFGQALLGDGLCAAAERFLFREGHPRFARQCASDAVSAWTAAGDLCDDEGVGTAATLVLMARVWNRLEGATHAGGPTARDLLRSPYRLIDWLHGIGEVSAIAELWATERPAVAHELLELASAGIGADGSLLIACAHALLRPAILTKDPEQAFDKLLTLLEPAHISDAACNGLQRIARELGSGDIGTAEVGSRNAILRDLTAVEAELSRIPRGAQAVWDVLVDELPSVLRRIIEAPRATEPKLKCSENIGELFLLDRSESLRVPIILENALDAGPAVNLHVRLAPLEVGLALDPEERPLATLEPGDFAEASFFLDLHPKQFPTADRLGFRAEIKRDSAVISSHTVWFGLRPLSRRNRKSPYQPGVALHANEGFVGRGRQLKAISDALLADVAVRVPLVVGIRRVGKTSLLYAILRDDEITRRFVGEYMSLEDTPTSDTSVEFLLRIAERLRAMADRAAGRANAVALSREAFRRDPYAAFEEFTTRLEALGSNRRLLLVLDEFDKLLHVIETGKDHVARTGTLGRPDEILQPEVFGALRKMILRSRNVRLVIAGLPRLLHGGYDARFFGLLDPVKLEGFTADEAKEVLQAAASTMKFMPQAENWVLRESGGQPFLLQRICHDVFAHMLDEGRSLVTPEDVKTVIERDILPNQGYFTDFLDLITDENRALLRALAELHARVPWRIFVSLNELVQALREQGVSPDEARARLEDLMTGDRPLVERSANQRYYRLAIGLLGHCLRR